MEFDIVDVGGDKEAVIHKASASDVRAVADYCAARRSVGDVGSSEMKVAASVPAFVILDWCNKKGIDFATFFRDPKLADQFLGDPENRAFRIWEGRV